MTNPLLVILTISMLLLMTATAVLAILYAAKKKGSANETIRNLSLLLLCYLIFTFLQFYFLQNTLPLPLIHSTGMLGDICYFLFIYHWVCLLRTFSKDFSIVKTKTLGGITLLYGVASQLIVVSYGSYSPPTFDFQVMNPMANYLLLFMNVAYDLWVLYLALRFYRLCKNNQTEKIEQIQAQVFGIPLILYMVWILLWDLNQSLGILGRVMDFFVVDPLLIVYCIFSLAILYFFFKKDPLELYTEQVQAACVAQLPQFITAFGLTKREGEVLELVCSGLNNPDMAEVLCISEHTIKRHMNHIFQKAEVSNRYELITKVLSP